MSAYGKRPQADPEYNLQLARKQFLLFAFSFNAGDDNNVLAINEMSIKYCKKILNNIKYDKN